MAQCYMSRSDDHCILLQGIPLQANTPPHTQPNSRDPRPVLILKKCCDLLDIFLVQVKSTFFSFSIFGLVFYLLDLDLF